MSAIIFLLFSSIWESIRSRAALQAEIFALRHQLLVLQRTARGRKLTDSFQSQSSLAIEEASAAFDLPEWSFLVGTPLLLWSLVDPFVARLYPDPPSSELNRAITPDGRDSAVSVLRLFLLDCQSHGPLNALLPSLLEDVNAQDANENVANLRYLLGGQVAAKFFQIPEIAWAGHGSSVKGVLALRIAGVI